MVKSSREVRLRPERDVLESVGRARVGCSDHVCADAGSAVLKIVAFDVRVRFPVDNEARGLLKAVTSSQ